MVAITPPLFSQAADTASTTWIGPTARTSSPRVVIVDESPECREVLHTLLESRGVATAEARGAREGLELVRRYHPEVVVLDLDAEAADDDSFRDALDSATREHHTALVVLGTARRYLEQLPDGQVLAKPYHYAPLIRTIERLLAQIHATPMLARRYPPGALDPDFKP